MREEKMSKYLRHFWIKSFMFVVLTTLVFLAGCSGSDYDEKSSPQLISADFSSFNEGSNETQYIVMTLAFDKEIKADSFEPKIRIANETLKSKNITVTAEGSNLVLKVLVDKIKDGDITVKLGDPDKGTLPAITDASGKYAAMAQTIEALAPSGLALETVNDDSRSVTVRVTHIFDIRCIAWILFEDGGETVGASLLNGADELGGAVALHGHEFLTDDLYDVAANLAETLTNHFGDRYEFMVDGMAVTATSKSSVDAELSISIYNYVRIGE
jgi:hypothetical protein